MHRVNVAHLQEGGSVGHHRLCSQRARKGFDMLCIRVCDPGDFGAETARCTAVPETHPASANDSNAQCRMPSTREFHLMSIAADGYDPPPTRGLPFSALSASEAIDICGFPRHPITLTFARPSACNN